MSSTSPDPQKEIAITNNSGGPIVLLIPTLAASSTDPVDGMVANSNLQLLPAIDGTLSVADGATKTFVLDQSYTDPKTGQQAYSTLYNLIPSTATWYSPVANIGVMQDFFSDPPKYPPQTVGKDEASSIINAGLFYQTIAAYPTSALATSYSAAMSKASSAGRSAADGSAGSSDKVADAVGGAVDAFFKTTKGFQNVTMASLVVMETYYQTFPFVWAKYDSDTYYLYSSDGKTTSFVGTVSLTKPATLDITKPNAGYDCKFTPAVNPSDTTTVDVDASQAKSLTYVDGLFVDNIAADVPGVAVKGTFQIKSLFTQKPADAQIITVLTGTIAGATVIGFDQPQKSNDPSGSDFWNSIFHPQNSAQIFQAVMTIGGAVMMLVFFGQMAMGIYRWAKGLAAKAEPTTAEMLKAQQESFEKILSEKIDAAVHKLNAGRGEKPPNNPEDAINELSTQRDVVTNNQNAANVEDGLNAQADTVQSLAPYESQMTSDQLTKLEGTAQELKSSDQALKGATPDTLQQVVSDQTTNLGKIQADTTSVSTELGDQLSAASQQSIAENTATTTEASKMIEDSTKANEDLPSDGDPPVEESVKLPEIAP